MATVTRAGFVQDAFDAFLARRDEPDWLRELRRQSWERFLVTPLPTTSLEEWRRTDIRALKLDRFGLPGEALATAELPPALLTELPAALLTAGVELAGQTVALDSQTQDVHDGQLEPELRRQGVLFGSLDRLLVEHEAVLRPHFLSVVDPTHDKFAALHGAAWSGGSVLYVPRGVKIERPLHMFSALRAGAADFGHTLVVLEEGAEATVLGETAGGGDSGLHCGAIELVVGPGASLRYVNLQNWSNGVWHFAHQRAVVQRHAQLQWTIGALGSRLAKVNQHVALTGAGSRAQVNGVMFTEGRQHLSYHTLQHHQCEQGTSDLLYKGALQDQSRVVWRGMIKVDPAAQKTNAYQRNDNLMLSESSRADSIPGLEIEADDVICTHGATAGRVDDEQVFYTRCRGLTRNEAVRTIVAGFFQQVFDRITIASVREALGEAIGRRIREFN
ncbi:MAG: Fe-S cluster assembly protein SufD [Pirellulales bacterium]|nr:Fe-S cluster assembly protein SufD [Pirellulales bacterium]